MLTMQAVRIHRYGGPEVLSYEEAPLPQPAAGEVRVKVHAAGVNPVDWKIREGWRKDRLNHTLPLILGWDVSGEVDAVSSDVTRFKIGDQVFSRPALSRDGAYAQYIVIRDSELAFKPRSVDHVHAAGVPLAALTAWQALFDAARLEPGQTVLVHAAAGGVGSFAVQLAKWIGARVIGTASARNREFVLGLGADEVVDYRTTPFEQAVRDVDVVFDTLGGEIQRRSWQVLKPGGVLVSILEAPSDAEARAHQARGAYVFVQPNALQLAEIASLVDNGTLHVPVETVLPLTKVREAHELSQSGHARGKIVLTVN